ncbi:hypothetical protein L484_000598 [Morus notabilis]|uniref:Uncharacterized protein n=1 Tax=Morus notabilis TaxID=981085 RepID=W9SL49_9ROSA|nr:hypothetical protein L484_000598 [Morus notabilis]
MISGSDGGAGVPQRRTPECRDGGHRNAATAEDDGGRQLWTPGGEKQRGDDPPRMGRLGTGHYTRVSPVPLALKY